MARPARILEMTAEGRRELETILSSRSQPSGLHVRARIVLQCMEGGKLADIARANRVSIPTVIRWRDRYFESGIAGLSDHSRTGRPIVYGQDFKTVVLSKLEESPPAGYAQWDGALLAAQTGYSKHAIWRLLRSQRICLARKRSWCVSTDPDFTAKTADIVGLYLSPPKNALVVCVDEKPNMQTLERLRGYAVSSDKKLIHGLESTYKRNGTLDLFAALEVATNLVHTEGTEPSRKTKKGFLSFMDELLVDLPEAAEYHVILDNHSIHKRHSLWLENHPNVFFHYTPTSASWLNMVEIWFGILRLKSLQGQSFSSTESLGKHIKRFQAAYNKATQPFVWRKRNIRGVQLSNSIHNFCN